MDEAVPATGQDEVFTAMVGDIAMLQPVILPFPRVYKSGIELFATAKEAGRKGGRVRIWGVLEGPLRDQRRAYKLDYEDKQ